MARMFPTLVYAVRADGLKDDVSSKTLQSYFKGMIFSSYIIKYSMSTLGILKSRVYPLRRFRGNNFTSSVASVINISCNISFASRRSYSYSQEAVEFAITRALDSSYAISRDASADFWREISRDCGSLGELSRGVGSRGKWFNLEPIMSSPLWGNNSPSWFFELWKELRSDLLSRNENWEVWVNAYDRIILGNNAFDSDTNIEKTLAKALAGLPDGFWAKDVPETNAELTSIIFGAFPEVAARADEDINSTASEISVDPLPLQGAGPHFELREDFLIDRADPRHFDHNGNNVTRIEQLRPLVIQACRDVQAKMPGNVFPEILNYIENYIDLLDCSDPNSVPWGEIWGLGVLLRNASDAAARSIEGRLLPEMEDPAKAALAGLLALHAPMILATREGQELTSQAQDFNQTRDEMQSFRKLAESISEAISRSPHIATPNAASMIQASTNAVGVGSHPERGAAYGLSGLRNIMIPVVAAAVASSPAAIGYTMFGPAGIIYTSPASLIAIESVKKSSEFIALTTALGKGFDEFSVGNLAEWIQKNYEKLVPFKKFIVDNQEKLRSIAQIFSEFRWISEYIDAIISDETDRWH